MQPSRSSTDVLEALKDLLVAVKFKSPPVNFGTDNDPNLCWEARVPIAFVEVAEKAIAKAEERP